MLDQDFVTFHRMRILDNIYRTITRMRNLRGAEIHNMTEQERRTVRLLRDGGYL